jgi:hypothetical protein
MILKIFCIKLKYFKIYIFINKIFFERSEIAFSLEKCIMDQTCLVVHKGRRPQARLETVTLFYIHCG